MTDVAQQAPAQMPGAAIGPEALAVTEAVQSAKAPSEVAREKIAAFKAKLAKGDNPAPKEEQTAEAAPEPAKAEPPAQPKKSWAEIAKEQSEARKARDAEAQRATELTQAKQRIAEYEAKIQSIKARPLDALGELGVSYADLVNQQLGIKTQQQAAPQQQAALPPGMVELQKQQAELAQAIAAIRAEKEQSAMQSSVQAWRSNAEALATADPSKYEWLALEAEAREVPIGVLAGMQRGEWYQQYGQDLTPEQALEVANERLGKAYEKIKARLTAQAAAPVANAQPAEKAKAKPSSKPTTKGTATMNHAQRVAAYKAKLLASR